MNANLFLKEMKLNLLSFTLWTAVITILISATMMLYPVFMENQSQIFGMMKLLPEGALQFKGISDLTDILSVIGFYSANNVIYMMLLGSIFAIVLSSNILLKEEYDKTAEYLLTRPVTRKETFISKLSVLAVYVLLLNLITSLAGFTSMMIFKDAPFNIVSFLILSLYTLLLNCVFGAAGLFISTLVRKPKSITALCIALVLVFYFVDTISKITEDVYWIGYASPFPYVDIKVAGPDYHLNMWHLVYFTGLSLIFILSALHLYNRKDIYV